MLEAGCRYCVIEDEDNTTCEWLPILPWLTWCDVKVLPGITLLESEMWDPVLIVGYIRCQRKAATSNLVLNHCPTATILPFPVRLHSTCRS